MKFVVKKTTELSDSEKAMMLRLFNDIMKRDRTLEESNNQFLKNDLGYSFHSMIIDDEHIVGCDTFIPSYYLVNGERRLFVNAVDTMVSKPYRDFLSFYEMVITAYDYLKEQGVSFVYSFPNDNSYMVELKAKLTYDIGRLNIYCLPYRIGGIIQKFKFLNSVSIFFSRIYVNYSSLLSSKRIAQFEIEKDAETYNTTRYKRLDSNYNIINLKDMTFIYKIIIYHDIKTAFLIDFLPKSSCNLNKSIKYIIDKSNYEFDLLLYVGSLPFSHSGLIKLPRKFEPKRFNFTGKILDNSKISKNIFNIKNWDVNLSNYDLL